MSIRNYMMCVAGAMLLGACTTDGSMTVASADTAAQTAGAEGEEVCKKVVVEGSSYLKEVCKSPEEWEDMREAAAQQVEEKDPDRVICKRTQVTGSKFTKLVCKPWSEWKALQDDSRSKTSQFQRRSTHINRPNN